VNEFLKEQTPGGACEVRETNPIPKAKWKKTEFVSQREGPTARGLMGVKCLTANVQWH